MAFEFFIGRRYLKAKQKQVFVSLITWLSTLGVAVGVAVLMVVIAVMTGFEAELKSRILGIEPHVLIKRYYEGITDLDSLLGKIEEVPGVTSAAPFIISQTMLRSAKGISGAVNLGL